MGSIINFLTSFHNQINAKVLNLQASSGYGARCAQFGAKGLPQMVALTKRR